MSVEANYQPSWVAGVRSAATRLDGELKRSDPAGSPADYAIAENAIAEART